MSWEDSSPLSYSEIDRRARENHVPDFEDTWGVSYEDWSKKRRECIEEGRDWDE